MKKMMGSTWEGILSDLTGFESISEDLKRFERIIRSLDYFTLTGLQELITISGSLALALTFYNDFLTPRKVWELSNLDENWQKKQWGLDKESEIISKKKWENFKKACNFLDLLKNK